MNDYLQGLNENQYKAVTSDAQVLRLIAGAGSGKTRVLTTRIAYLIEHCHIPPYKILAITFTNKAANEMRKRVGVLLNNQQHQVWLSTIHALCVRILREECIAINYPRNFSIADVDDQKAILKEAYKQYNIDLKLFSYNSVLNYIANQKYALITPSEAIDKANALVGEKTKALCYKFYQERLSGMFAFDFDDLILQTLKIFQTFPAIQGKWQSRFSHIMVDEFQDVDRFEYELVKRLTGYDNSLCVVGDPDQTIYTWRGADVNIILDFNKDFINCETIFLNENYRSTPIILNAANSLIANNKNRIKKDLFTKKIDKDKIIHLSFANEESEARWIVKEINRLHETGIKYEDMAILYRSNYISRQFEKELLDLKIPYVIWGGTKFFDRAEIKNALSYLQMVVSNNDLAFKRIINIPRRGIGEKTLDNLLTKAQTNKCSMFEAINIQPFASSKAQSALIQFYDMVTQWKVKKDDLSMIELMDLILDQSGYRESLTQERETDRIENLKELLSDMQNYLLRYPDSDLDEYLQVVSTYSDKDDNTDSDYLRLMTVHSAKGLEFDNVFVVGMSDGVFPNERAMSEGTLGLEEERRLAYVAFTRAKKHLYISDCQGFSYQLQQSKVTSRFIKEMNQDLIDEKNFAYENHYNQTSYRNTPSRAYEKAILDDENNDTGYSVVGKVTNDYRPGQKVVHDNFGDGIVVKVNGNFVEVAFKYPYGVKKLLASAKALHHRLKS